MEGTSGLTVMAIITILGMEAWKRTELGAFKDLNCLNLVGS
jgi:hypothetical protein